MDEYRGRFASHARPAPHPEPPPPEPHFAPEPPRGFLSNLPFGGDFLENNWLIVLVIAAAIFLYFLLGQQEFGISSLLGGFLK